METPEQSAISVLNNKKNRATCFHCRFWTSKCQLGRLVLQMFSWQLTINKPDLQYIKTPKVTSGNKRIRWLALQIRYQCFRLFLFYSVNSIKVRIVNGQIKWSRVNYLMLATLLAFDLTWYSPDPSSHIHDKEKNKYSWYKVLCRANQWTGFDLIGASVMKEWNSHSTG